MSNFVRCSGARRTIEDSCDGKMGDTADSGKNVDGSYQKRT